MECIERLAFRSQQLKYTKTGRGEQMTLVIGSAVVVDDAFGPPASGTIDVEDKSKWVEHIAETEEAQNALRMVLYEGHGPELDALLIEATSEHKAIVKLWKAHELNAHPAANLGLLFGKAELILQGQKSVPQMVVDKLKILYGEDKIKVFPDMDAAVASLSTADVAFIDFYLKDNETDDDALARITKHVEILKRVKLLFVMSSKATLENQQKVRRIVGLRTSFFEVLLKKDITENMLDLRISRKVDTYSANKALEEVIDSLVSAAETAIKDFKEQCDDLEVHDLRLLDLARLDAEQESIPEYLTWLFSEAVAAKTRRIALPMTLKNTLKTEAIGFSGQIQQGKSLFSLFAEVVFGPPVKSDTAIRFGEVLCDVATGKHILILSPACDLQRCELTRPVLCVSAIATKYSSYKELAEKKLYGKLKDGGLRHLLCGSKDESPTYAMLEWQTDDIATHIVQDLQSNKYERIALMNEIFAQEVKEEVLRSLGRVGTQIDPPPPIALNAKLRWKNNGVEQEQDTPHDSFISALLTYAEVRTDPKKNGKSVVLSDEFKDWAIKTIRESFGNTEVPPKMENSLVALQDTRQFTFGEKKSAPAADGDLKVKVLQPSELTEMDKCQVEIVLLVPDINPTDTKKDFQAVNK